MRPVGPTSDCTGQLTVALSPDTHHVVFDCGDGQVDGRLLQDREEHLRLLWSPSEIDDYTRQRG
ncbi:hypothetical protein H074_02062 [Amycolatopsis decaplanina DSM 44594]|uniref:Uncharacterized protein n=2 Tax=Amycolatopsis decaplanina TaxID=208441 RepID=M2ZBH4_9PSEU|nr:hypothetical protein H074_02062 [Amycolatopsis decaplanina DSM 44594]